MTAIERARESYSLAEAIVRAAEARFRPILLTSITTMLGLTPLLMEVSAQAQWIKPIVVSLAFGVFFSTAVTLLLVPAIYAILDMRNGVPFAQPSSTGRGQALDGGARWRNAVAVHRGSGGAP